MALQTKRERSPIPSRSAHSTARMEQSIQCNTLLSEICGIDEQTLEKLHAVRITTLSHLIRQNPGELQRLCGVPATEVRRALEAVAHAAGARRQLDPPPKARLRTGVAALDDALGGGFLCGGLTEIYGRGAQPLCAFTLRANADVSRVHVIVGGGRGRIRTRGARRLVVDGPDALLKCIEALRADALAMRALQMTMPVLVVIDGATRSLALPFGMGAPVRAKARARMDRVAGAMRALAVDSQAAVVIVAQSMPRLGRAWLHVVDARVTIERVCVSLGCYRDYSDEIEGGGFAKRMCEHVCARIVRKDGPGCEVEIDLVKIGIYA